MATPNKDDEDNGGDELDPLKLVELKRRAETEIDSKQKLMDEGKHVESESMPTKDSKTAHCRVSNTESRGANKLGAVDKNCFLDPEAKGVPVVEPQPGNIAISKAKPAAKITLSFLGTKGSVAMEDDKEDELDPLKIVELKRRAELELQVEHNESSPKKKDTKHLTLSKHHSDTTGTKAEPNNDELDPLKIVELRRQAQTQMATREDISMQPGEYNSQEARRNGCSNVTMEVMAEQPSDEPNGENDPIILKLVQSRARQALEEEQAALPRRTPDRTTTSNKESEDSLSAPRSGKQRQKPTIASSQPGAFAGAPGAGLERLASLRYSQLERLNGDQMQQMLALEESKRSMMMTSKASILQDAQITQSGRNLDKKAESITRVDETTGLSVARAVNEPSQRNLPQASFMGDLEQVNEETDAKESEQQQRALQSTLLWVCGGLILLAIVLVVVFVVALKPNDDTPIQSTSRGVNIMGDQLMVPSAAPSVSLGSYVAALLPDHSLDAMGDKGSPQFEAFQWLLDDANLTVAGDGESVLSYPDWRIQQRFALATFYFATKGDRWMKNDNWLSPLHECQWFARPERPCVCKTGGDIEDYIANSTGPCGDVTNTERYTALRLSGNGLKGTLPKEVYLLTSLSTLQLLHNKLEGTLASDIGWLKNLSRVDLSKNTLSGSIPSEVFSPIMRDFSVFGNNIAGTIPTEIGLATNLKNFFVEEAILTGNLPSEIGMAKSLVTVYLDANQISGSLPTELGLLDQLEVVYLQKNMLTSAIPSEIGRLPNLLSLRLRSNMLSSSIPSELAMCTQLTHILLQKNMLTSAIPSELGQLPNLYDLHLSSNMLSSSIPSELAMATQLWHVYVNANQLTSTLPTELGQLNPDPQYVGFKMLFGSNQITGPIPSEFGNLSNLIGLQLSQNFLTSTIPTELGGLSKLSYLYLQHTDVTGPIPSEFGQLSALESLGLHNNSLSGLIPDTLEQLATNMTDVDFSNNPGLEGLIPEGLCFLNTSLVFDCSASLCGCWWCDCDEAIGMNYTT
ncbi:LRR receptor-like serine threonine-protein kinase [Seminavis robusta]|uniref:LRR receptor-like serine threonine-protein kinase n=1 Tax=Seminavis robusta TaxID=568900 RepID=A0A9N8E4R4_9STRA|nr:LRR receptor-like serine threonine-protein kinase [Seminavis robusta]|eukprot:Sro548_g164490.1 LRR receptor-like serine threonine-protein kinase (1026) ;mRNA; f:54075-57246